MSSYVQTILTAVIAFPFIAFLFTFPYIIYNYRKYGSVLSFRILIVYSFILYLLCVYFLVILPLPSIDEVARMTGPRIQSVPFMFIRDIFQESDFHLRDVSTWITLIKNKAFFQVFFNFIMIIPFGIYLRYYFRCGFRRTFLFSFLLSLFFELTQLTGLYFLYPRGYRLFDVDDLLINTLGGIAGYLCAPAFMRLLPSRENMDKASIRRGMEVSLPRRVLALCFDMFLIFLADAALRAALPGGRQMPGSLWLIPAFLYYSFVPALTGGRTAGKWILRIRIGATATGGRPHWYQYPLRCGSLLLFLFALPRIFSLLPPLPAFLCYTALSGTGICSMNGCPAQEIFRPWRTSPVALRKFPLNISSLKNICQNSGFRHFTIRSTTWTNVCVSTDILFK